MWIVIFGNPSKGFEFVGPFNDAMSASEHGERISAGHDWWVAEVIRPKKLGV
jgi:hypothetical protein